MILTERFKFTILVISMELSIRSKAFPKAKEDNAIGNPVPISFFNSAVNHSYKSMCCIFIYIFSFGTRARSPQQREPITVSPYYLTPLSTFPMRGNRTTRRKPTTFGRALTILFLHEDWVRIHIKMNLTGDRTRNLRG